MQNFSGPDSDLLRILVRTGPEKTASAAHLVSFDPDLVCS